MSAKFNSSPYFNKKIYNKVYSNDVSKMVQQISSELAGTKTPMIRHFLDKGDLVPTWALFNNFSFGTIRQFYKILEIDLKRNIAFNYGLNNKSKPYIKPKNLDTMLSNINAFRNVCAHNNRLFNYSMNDLDKSISNMNIHSLLGIKKNNNEYVKGKKDLFSIVICFKYLLKDDDFKSFFDKLKEIVDNLSNELCVININIILDKMGFPRFDVQTGEHDWTDILKLNK